MIIFTPGIEFGSRSSSTTVVTDVEISTSTDDIFATSSPTKTSKENEIGTGNASTIANINTEIALETDDVNTTSLPMRTPSRKEAVSGVSSMILTTDKEASSELSEYLLQFLTEAEEDLNSI